MSAAIRRTVVTGGYPWDPGSGIDTVTDHACTLVVTEYSLHERASTMIGATDRKVLVAAEGLKITPTAADLLVIGETAYEIKRLDPLAPAGVVVMYQAQCVF